VHQGIVSLERQQGRLLDAYLTEVIALTEFERKRTELAPRREHLQAQWRQLEAMTEQHHELTHIAASSDEFCRHIQAGLDQATFEEQRALVELLIDCVVVADAEVEIRYTMPLSRAGPHRRFCHLRLDYRAPVPVRLRNGASGDAGAT
jgi:site-specific DNA recombinase